MAFAMFNCVVGASIFRLPGEAAAMLGPAAVLAYLVCSLVLALVGLCLAEVGSRVTEAGGLYAYAAVAFGPVVGGMVGTLSWVAYVSGAAAVTDLWAETMATLSPPMQSGSARAALVVAAWGLLAAVNVRGAREGASLSFVLGFAKLAPLLLIAVIGIAAAEPANLRVATLPSPTKFGEAVVLLFFSFGGIESGLTASGEVVDPPRTIPRAILIAASLVSALYMGLQLAAQGVLGAALPGAAAPLVSVASVTLGPWGARLMIAATVLSSSGYLVADALCSPRALYAMAARRQLPRRLASLHPRFGTPAFAVCVYALLCASITLSGSFRALALFSSSTTLTAYLVSCLALLRLRARQVAQSGAPFRAPGGVALPIAAALLVGVLLASLSREALLAALLPVSVAAVAYVLQARSQRWHGPADD